MQTIQSCQGLSDAEKHNCKEGWDRLAKLLGDQWLSSIKADHPLRSWTPISLPWAIKWLSDLGNKLIELQTLERFKTLLNNLKGSQWRETLSELEICSRLKRSGFDIELYPKLDSGGKTDVKARKNGEDSWWEVTTTMESGYEKNAKSTWSALALNGLPQSITTNVNIRFKIHRSLRSDEINGFIEIRNQKITEAITSDGYREIHNPGIVDYYIATDDQFQRIPEDMQGSLSIPLTVDQGNRIINKVIDELKQLPTDKPGVIAIFNNFLWEQDLDSELIGRIRETVDLYKNVYCVFITIASLGRGEECEMKFEDHKLIQRIKYNAIVERTFVVSNPAYEVDQLMEIFR